MHGRNAAVWTLGMLGLAGCLAGRGQVDLLQARLREQEQQLADLQSQLQDKDKALAQSRRAEDELRRQIALSTPQGLLPEQSDLLVRVAGIRINSMLTAGIDRDQTPGDDALFVQFAPYDADGELVKLPGEIEISVLDPALPDQERTIARWTIPAEKCREHWTRGLFGAGYQFTLPWNDQPPRNGELVLHVRLKPVDGREFSATHVLRITPPVEQAVDTRTSRKPPHSGEAPLIESTNWTERSLPVRR
jgi:hypothetical protein